MKSRRIRFSTTARRFTLAVPLAVAMVLGGAAAAQGQESNPATAGTIRVIPENLVPPAGQQLSSVFQATGVQVYQCTAGAWVFVEPAAGLTGRVKGPTGQRRHAAIHFRGPSWQSTDDGSFVEAKLVAASPVAGSIPQLLLQATRNRGDGVFGRVTYLQRLATRGGVAPTGGCADGATTGVTYSAEYRFYVAES